MHGRIDSEGNEEPEEKDQGGKFEGMLEVQGVLSEGLLEGWKMREKRGVNGTGRNRMLE